jgi:methionine sulfoxide reductase heme-binding subunit
MIGEHFFWITSRAAGIAALLAASAAVAVGLWMSGRRKGADLRTTHEALSLATLVALGVHALSLLGDTFLAPSLADVTLPFAWGYKTLWSTTGIIAGWMLVILGLSYYARGRIGPARWRKLHRFTALAWVLGLVHSLGEGTDASALWFLVATLMVALPAGALLVKRLTPEVAS